MSELKQLKPFSRFVCSFPYFCFSRVRAHVWWDSRGVQPDSEGSLRTHQPCAETGPYPSAGGTNPWHALGRHLVLRFHLNLHLDLDLNLHHHCQAITSPLSSFRTAQRKLHTLLATGTQPRQILPTNYRNSTRTCCDFHQNPGPNEDDILWLMRALNLPENPLWNYLSCRTSRNPTHPDYYS